jgi:putative ABC transport system substrate-binding protein
MKRQIVSGQAMERRAFLSLLGGAAAASSNFLPLAARAQRLARLPTVAFFSPGTLEDFRTQGFQQGLRDLGYEPGRNIVVDYVFAPPDQLSQRALEIVARRPDVIVAATTPPALAAMRATPTIPIVATSISDPVGAGLAESLARPGRNVTSLSNVGHDIAGKRLEILKETIPGLARVATLINPDDPTTPNQLAQVRAAAAALGLQLNVFAIRASSDFNQVFAAMAAGNQALMVTQVGFFLNNRARTSALALDHRMPAMFSSREEAQVGGLLSYGPDLKALFHRAASQVDKILKGTRPAEIPVEQPVKFELVNNLRTARTLGFNAPPRMLARADEVIE